MQTIMRLTVVLRSVKRVFYSAGIDSDPRLGAREKVKSRHERCVNTTRGGAAIGGTDLVTLARHTHMMLYDVLYIG